MPHSPEEKSAPRGSVSPLASCEPLITSLYSQAEAARWNLSRAQFVCALDRSVRKRFLEGMPSEERLEEYLQTLHVSDLALTTACLEGRESAWEYFVREYRGYLRAAAGAITKSSQYGANPEELADSLFSDLFGLMDGKRGEHSLFRYFHGRSSLKTWLRTVLAQRHVDYIRSRRRWESLDADDGEKRELPAEPSHLPMLDPYRSHYLSCFTAALKRGLEDLVPADRQRLDLYYVRQLKLAEIGKMLGEHESSVSRNLDRIRREMRSHTERLLREAYSMSDAEISQCFEYAAEDVPIDFRQLFPENKSGKSPAGGKDPS